MSMENFKRKVGEKIEDIKSPIEIKLDEKKEWIDRLMGGDSLKEEGLQTYNLEYKDSKKWGHGPVLIASNELQKTSLPLFLAELEIPKTFRSKYGKMSKSTEVGEITILSLGKTDEGQTFEYGQLGSIQKAGFSLLKDVKKALHELAAAIENNDPAVSDIKYFYGVSRLASIADSFGFDTFDLNEAMSKDSLSHGWAKAQYEHSGARKDQLNNIDRREAKLAVVSREKLLEYYGMKQKKLAA